VVVRFCEAAVTETSAHELLTEYFEYRANGFPAGPFAYLRSFPRPEQFMPPAGVFLLVELDGAQVGCGGIRAIEGEGPLQPVTGDSEGSTVRVAGNAADARFEAKHLYIKPGVRGHGLGRALLDELERRARGFGGTELVLDTNSNLEAARALYLTSGFESIEPYNDNPNATNWYGKNLSSQR
jgi:GNAT superfamily N-acetyltransferase